jgi:hypothetical protein
LSPRRPVSLSFKSPHLPISPSPIHPFSPSLLVFGLSRYRFALI